MIDPKLFTVNKLLATILNARYDNKWRLLAEIIPDYKPPYAHSTEQTKCVVKCGEQFLRHSAGPCQGHFWDIYGDDYLTPELALIALVQAPIPSIFIDNATWQLIRDLTTDNILSE